MKLICLDCGTQYDSGKFCPECGTKLQEIVPELVCPSCGTKAKSGKFCAGCGTKLVEQVDAVPSSITIENKDKRKFNEKDHRFAKYYDRNGFPRDIPQEERDLAIEEFKTYADQGSSEAKMLLGKILIQEDPNTAIELIKEAEEAGDKLAYYLMGRLYMCSTDDSLVIQNDSEAEKRLIEMYQEYQNGDVAQILAELYAYSNEKCDYKKAFEFATIAAEDDKTLGYNVLGLLYLNGWGVDQNIQLALENYKMAAADGDEISMNQIGFIYMNGDGIEENPEQAFYWFNEAAQKKYDVGMYNLGYCYKNGYGVEQDAEVGAEWLKKAAEAGCIDSMIELGEYYQDTLFDIKKSKAWFLKAAENGSADAMNKLGILYTDIDPDYQEAVKWFLKAIEQDNPWAYRNYAWCLWNGNGVKANKKKAMKMMQKAISLGLSDAEQELMQMQVPTTFKDESASSEKHVSNEWIVPEGTKVLNNRKLPSTDIGWRQSIEKICLPKDLREIDLFIDDSFGLEMFPNLKKLVVPTGEFDRFCEMDSWIEASWDKVWNNDGVHICPELMPIVCDAKDYAVTLYGQEVIGRTYKHHHFLILSPKCREIKKETFMFDKELEVIYMNDGLELIGKNAFYGCKNLKTVRLSKNVKILQKGLFRNCDSLKEIIVPEGVTEIKEAAFASCRSLETITLPSTITIIDKGGIWGLNPFQLCNSLKKIIVPKGTIGHFQSLLKGFSENPTQYLVEAQ